MATDGSSPSTLGFEEFPDVSLVVFLVKNVQNTAEIRQLIMSGTLNPEAAIVNATLVPDLFVLHVAARAALVAHARSALKTRSLHAEVVWNVAGSKHIAESLSRYGVNEDTPHLLIARFNATPEEMQSLRALAQGEVVPLEELATLADEAALRKYHKIADEELRMGTLVDAVVNRIAIRDLL